MRSTTNWAWGTTALSRLSPELSKQARQRLQWIEHVQTHGNKSLTCRYFGISRPTLNWHRSASAQIRNNGIEEA
jgi:hypothetical protein